jgi:tetratricopeptide (TPR) repeat protein
MFNKSSISHSLRHIVSQGLPFFVIYSTLLLSACSVSQDAPFTDSKTTLSSENNEAYAEAISAMKSGDIESAHTLLINLINQQPNLSNAHVNLGIIFITKKSFNEAENSFNLALKIDPNNIYALNQLGYIYRINGDFPKAKASYEKAIDINSDYANAHLNLGILYDLYMYDLENAIEQYKIYTNLSKEDKKVDKWIVDLERRLKKSLALK